MTQLNPDLKIKTKKAFKDFLSSYEAGEFEEHEREVFERISYFQDKLPERVDDLSMVDLEEILSNTWAVSRIWGNLQYRAQEIIADNGIEKIKKAFKILLDTSIPPHKRYRKVLKMIKGLGSASITEIMAYIQPDDCAIWNRRAREALEILGIDNINTNKYTPSPEEYKNYIQIVKSINKELKPKKKAKSMGLLFTDFFFYKLSQTPQNTPKTEPEIEDFDHDEIRDLTRDIGDMLGFKADTEVQIAHGARVDVVWSARIGNLGIIKYVFEVHKRGSIDSLLMNLQKAKSNPTVQKVIAISNETQLQKIQNESKGLPEEFRRNLELWPFEEVLIVAENLETAMGIIKRLNLTPE